MTISITRIHTLPLGLLLAALVLPGSLAAQTGSTEPSLDEVRRAAERFQDVSVALAEGYVPDPTGMCVTADMEGLPAEAGSMGVHYFRPDMLGITATSPRVDGTGTHTDFLNPSILLYEPQADGSLVLLGVENLVFEAAWRAAGHDEAPIFQGTAYVHRVDDPGTEIDEAHGFLPHYELHAWVFRENPSGALEAYNPAVSCAHHGHHPLPGHQPPPAATGTGS